METTVVIEDVGVLSAFTKASHSIARLISAVTLMMLLTAQGFLLEHETEHALSGDEDSCLVCQLAVHKGDVLVDAGSSPSVVCGVPYQSSFAHAAETANQHYFSPRAPPASIERS